MIKHKDKIIVILLMVVLSALFLKNVIFTNKMLFGTDWLSGAYMQRDFFEKSIKDAHQFPLWNPNQFAGIPTGEGFFGEIFHPITLPLKYFTPTYVVWTLIFFMHMIIAGFGMFLYLKRKLKSVLTAAVFSLAYMFTSSMLSEIFGGHDGRFMVISYLPLLLYFIDRALESTKLKWFLMASIPSSLMLLTGHIQSSYYSIVFAIFYVSFNHINRSYKHKLRNYTFAFSLITGFLFSLLNQYLGFIVFLTITFSFPVFLDKKLNSESIKIYIYSIIFIFSTFLLSAVQYLPILRFLPFAARGLGRDYIYATSWSMGFPDILDQVVSGFAGINLNSTNTYWGENPFKLHSTYIGVIPMIFALSMLFSKKKKDIALFFSVAFVSIFILALGGNTPLYRIFYSLFPYVNKFRAPELILFTGVFSTIVLSAIFFEERESKTLIYVASATALFSIITLIFPQLLTDLFRNLAGQKEHALANAVKASSLSAFKTLVFSIIAYFSFKFAKGKYSVHIIILLGVLMVGDLWLNNSKFVIPVDSPKKYFAKDNIVRSIEQDKDIYRVFSFGYRNDDYLILHGFEIISGNHPSPFADYQKFINNGESVMFNPEKLFMIPNRVKFLNLKYAIVPYIPSDTAGYDTKSQNVILYYRSLYKTMGFTELKRVDNYSIATLPNYLPRAFCIDSYCVVEDFDSTLTIIDSDTTCGVKYAIFNEEPNIAKDTATLTANVKIEKYSPNRIELNVKSNKSCMLVLLDQYYSPWKCRVNDSQAKIYKAFGIFRGIKISQGDNKIVFWFDPKLQIFSAIISLLTIIFIIMFGILKKN